MELEELKRSWVEIADRIDTHLDLQQSKDRRKELENQLFRVRRLLWPLYWGQIAIVFFGIAMIVLGVAYWSNHRGWNHRLASGLVIHVYGIIVTMLAGIALGKFSRLDYNQPVLEIQVRLASLRRWYVFMGAAIGLPWWILWLVFMQVVFGLLGADFFGNVSTPFLVANVAVGIGGLLGTWAFHLWLKRPGREKLAYWFNRQAAGNGFTKATEELNKLAERD